ncbi:MAG: ZIP family metal transporter [Candidatus Paceibacterota bacterium]
MTLILIAVIAFCSAFVGGLFAFRFRDKLHLVLGFSAGAVMGVAFFDLLPEAIKLNENLFSLATTTTLVALGFIIYLILDRLLFLHPHGEEEENCANPHHHEKKSFSSLILAVHSFIDGLAVGLAFQVSTEVGLILTVAVLSHNFSDGLNIVGLALRHGHEKNRAWRWLITASLAPALGILTTLFIVVPEVWLGPILALFTGFFIYIGASELLPESHHGHSTRLTTFMTVLGLAFLYLIIKLAGV